MSENLLLNETSKFKHHDLCRVCLSIVKDKSLSLFENYKDHFVYTYIQLLTIVRIDKNDGYPDRICKHCLLELETAIHFKERCESSNRILLSTLITDVDIPVDIKEEKQDETLLVKKECLDDDDLSADNLDTNLIAVDISDCQFDDKSSENIKFQCHDCSEYFRTKCKLRVHWKKTHYPQSRIRVCPQCKLSFKTLHAYQNHMKNVTKRCRALGDQLIKIEGVGKNRTYYCKECDYNTTYLPNIIHHCARHSGSRPYQCDLCPRAFIQYASLSKHKEYTHKLHKHIITCYVCGKLLKGAETINRHLKTHTNERKFECNICKKKYKTKLILQDHMQKHQEKKYTCEVCAKVFYTASGLWTHIQYVHNKHNRKLFKCNICEYKNLKLFNIKQHERKHTDSNVACPVCGKFFEKAEKMLKHQQIHYAEKNFACSACDRKYLSADSLHKHQKAAHAMQFS